MKINNISKLVIAIVVSELAGITGSVFTTPSLAGWYAGLVKPALNPPSWVFGPVWTTLFALMGISAFLIWSSYAKASEGEKKGIKIALVIFISQLVLNILWSIIFFGLHNLGGAFIEIIFLWFAILATVIAFAKISKPAAWLLLPYILWVSFAGYLNYSIWQLNGSQGAESILCTQEAKLCSDGSYVGRTGPGCEFGVCPNGDNSNNLWNTTNDNKAGITFQYPEKLTTRYISTQEWPPVVRIQSGIYSCLEKPQEKSSLTETISQRLVDDRVYCVDVKHEGAAGSVYSSYVYTTLKKSNLIEVSFVLRYSSCDNYDQAQNQSCTSEREAFDIDATVDRIVQTVEWDLLPADNSS